MKKLRKRFKMKCQNITNKNHLKHEEPVLFLYNFFNLCQKFSRDCPKMPVCLPGTQRHLGGPGRAGGPVPAAQSPGGRRYQETRLAGGPPPPPAGQERTEGRPWPPLSANKRTKSIIYFPLYSKVTVANKVSTLNH